MRLRQRGHSVTTTYFAADPITGTTGLLDGSSLEYEIPAGEWVPGSAQEAEVATVLEALGFLRVQTSSAESAQKEG